MSIINRFIAKCHSENIENDDLPKMNNFNTAQSGWKRVQKMFSKDDKDFYSQEIYFIRYGFNVSLMCGFCLGSVRGVMITVEDYKRRNQATLFDHKGAAMRGLYDRIYLDMFRSGTKFGLKLSLFTSSFLLTSTTMSVYRGKTGVLDYIIAGGINGAIWKANMGLRGSFAGMSVGAIFGAITGVTTVGIMKLCRKSGCVSSIVDFRPTLDPPEKR